jgi:hypothetical protein
MVGNKQAIVKKALYLEEICWGNRIEVAATAQSNKPVAHRPYKDGWLSSRSCLRRVNGVVVLLQSSVGTVLKSLLLSAESDLINIPHRTKIVLTT